MKFICVLVSMHDDIKVTDPVCAPPVKDVVTREKFKNTLFVFLLYQFM